MAVASTSTFRISDLKSMHIGNSRSYNMRTQSRFPDGSEKRFKDGGGLLKKSSIVNICRITAGYLQKSCIGTEDSPTYNTSRPKYSSLMHIMQAVSFKKYSQIRKVLTIPLHFFGPFLVSENRNFARHLFRANHFCWRLHYQRLRNSNAGKQLKSISKSRQNGLLRMSVLNVERREKGEYI